MWPTAKLSITGLAKHTTPSLATRPLKMVYQRGEGAGEQARRQVGRWGGSGNNEGGTN